MNVRKVTGATAFLEKARPTQVALGRPQRSDGAAIHGLIAACKPLDLNSLYAYLLLAEHFGETCVVARAGSRVVGFVSAYVPPARAHTAFVWQVAVAESMRGTGLASAMLRELLARPALARCRYLETTVSPSNTASRRLFQALARAQRAQHTEGLLFGEEDFGGEHHECEMLIRIGPFQGEQPQGERAT
ncbi:MAG TPA: diaminobutyrate acetyltransferase [Burkholderiales bacterium]|nr:diaminobutyrate acetyltransferase [Burkholderiales bacterium]